MLTRRDFLKLIGATLGSAIASGCAPTLPDPTETPSPTPRPSRTPTLEPLPTATRAATPTSNAPAFVTIRGDQFYLRGELFPIKGFNYYPMLHPWKMFNVGEWDAKMVERELRLGTTLGANVVRIFVDHPFSLSTKTPQPTPTIATRTPQPTATYAAPLRQYVQNVREFLDIAGRLNFKVILTLFDSLDWFLYLPQNHWIAEEYVKAFVPQFVNDTRILCWDLQNEPDKAIRNLGAENVLPFFQRISTQVRKLDPNHLQTIGWIDRARTQYFPDLDNYLDFWCFHFYDNVERLPDLLQLYKLRTSKPVMLQEFGLATGGPGPDGQHTEEEQAAHYSTVFHLLERFQMCGSVFWILTDFPRGLAGNPPSPDDSPENHFGVFRLDYSEKPAAGVIRYYWK